VGGIQKNKNKNQKKNPGVEKASTAEKMADAHTKEGEGSSAHKGTTGGGGGGKAVGGVVKKDLKTQNQTSAQKQQSLNAGQKAAGKKGGQKAGDAALKKKN
jgi:hypothetical protein